PLTHTLSLHDALPIWLPGITRTVVDEALGMRAAILLEKTAEGEDLGPDRHAGDMVTRQRERRFLRPVFGFRIVDLMKPAIDPVADRKSTRLNSSHLGI